MFTGIDLGSLCFGSLAVWDRSQQFSLSVSWSRSPRFQSSPSSSFDFFFFSPFYFSYLFFVLRDLRVFFLLADFLPPSITNPRGFSRKRLAKEESCSTWKYHPVANFVAAIQHFFLDKVGNVCTLRSLIYHQVHSFVSSPSFFFVCVFNFKFRDETNAIFNQTNLEGYTLYTYPVNGEEVPSISRPVYPICLI